MPLRRSSLLLLALLALGVAAGASHDRAPRLSGEDWWIRPDPPSNDKDLEVTYVGSDADVDSATYTLDDGTPVPVDLTKSRRIRIPASKLRGVRAITFDAIGGGERGYRILRFPSSR